MSFLITCHQIWNLVKPQISKIIQSSGSFSSCLGNLGKKALILLFL